MTLTSPIIRMPRDHFCDHDPFWQTIDDQTLGTGTVFLCTDCRRLWELVMVDQWSGFFRRVSWRHCLKSWMLGRYVKVSTWT